MSSKFSRKLWLTIDDSLDWNKGYAGEQISLPLYVYIAYEALRSASY